MEGGVSVGDPARRVLRVAIVSEHGLARLGIARAVEQHSDMRVVGNFDCCRSAMGLLMKEPPDVVVVELSPGGGDVLDAIVRCHTAHPDVGHVVISQTRDPELAERSIKAGALAFLHKGVGPNGLANAIRDAAAGQLHVCRCVASPMLQEAIYSHGRHKRKHPELSKLSEREFQVFQLLGAGWDNQKIAGELGISIKTLNAHKEHLKQKLNVPTSVELKHSAERWQSVSGLR